VTISGASSYMRPWALGLILGIAASTLVFLALGIVWVAYGLIAIAVVGLAPLVMRMIRMRIPFPPYLMVVGFQSGYAMSLVIVLLAYILGIA
jgi:hypothetical protein